MKALSVVFRIFDPILRIFPRALVILGAVLVGAAVGLFFSR